jgi:hypothetical protein
MNTTHLPTTIRRSLRTLAATAVVLASLMLSSLPAGAQTTTTETTDGPTAAFCQAWADYQDAQDGAQLNTALGAMQEALATDAPAEVAEAIVTLGQGDLDPAEVQAAADTVAAWADEPCAEQSTTTTEATTTTTTEASTTTTTAAPTTTTTADSDEGEAPTGGVDTGAGGTATGSGPNGLILGLTAALIVAGAGAAVTANRRRPANRP